MSRFDGPYKLHQGEWDELQAGMVIPEEIDGRLHFVLYRCPCGDHNVSIKTQGSYLPDSWDGEFDENGLLTLSPSVNMLGDCKSHYIMSGGMVQWC